MPCPTTSHADNSTCASRPNSNTRHTPTTNTTHAVRNNTQSHRRRHRKVHPPRIAPLHTIHTRRSIHRPRRHTLPNPRLRLAANSRRQPRSAQAPQRPRIPTRTIPHSNVWSRPLHRQQRSRNGRLQPAQHIARRHAAQLDTRVDRQLYRMPPLCSGPRTHRRPRRHRPLPLGNNQNRRN